MALQTTNVDDRRYDQLLAVLRKQIPVSRWTDHNPSDPGMMLLELLCWLAEMTLYRMNRVSDAHRQKLLNLLIDPPQPVTVGVTFTVTFNAANLPLVQPIVIPVGTRLATDFVNGRRVVVETLSELQFTNPSPGNLVVAKTVRARELLVVTNDVLGESTGKANQTFQLSPPSSLKSSSDQYLPVLLDFVNVSATYNPNPEISVNGTPWKLVPFLLAEESKPAGGVAPQHVMVEPFENRIRFGNNVFGAIPPAGASIVATRYQVLQGPAALKQLHANSLKYILDPVLNLSPHTIAMTHEDAEGGLDIFPPGVRLAEGLKDFRRTFRVVTETDFEKVLLNDFNEFQDLSGTSPKLARAVAIMNRQPPLQPPVESPAHVTILVLPEFVESAFDSSSLVQKQNMLKLAPEVERKILRFLDERRLITTHLHVTTPTLLPVDITADVVVLKDRNETQMQAILKKRLQDFLSIRHGDFDRKGWRLGRDVYRSQIFRVLEDVDGVDYVRSLVLSPANADGNVTIAPDQLPVLQNAPVVTAARE
jgi:hypothetical protein